MPKNWGAAWHQLRATFGFGKGANPANRLGGVNTPGGRVTEIVNPDGTVKPIEQITVQDAISSAKAGSFSDSAEKHSWVYVESSNVHSYKFIPATRLEKVTHGYHADSRYKGSNITEHTIETKKYKPDPTYRGSKIVGHAMEQVEWKEVEEDYGTFYITFWKNKKKGIVGKTYAYDDFKEDWYFQMLTAGSKGHEVWVLIRWDHYPDGCGRYHIVPRSSVPS